MTSESLGELVTSLEGTAALPASWSVLQAKDSGDPVSDAWAASASPAHMIRLLQLVRAPGVERAMAAWATRASELGNGPHDEAHVCSGCADAIRAGVPPPTWSDVLATLRQLRAEDAHSWSLGVDPSAMIAVSVRSGVDPRVVARAVCRCARRAVALVTGLDARAKWALGVAERWAAGEEVTRAELHNAASAAKEALGAASGPEQEGQEGARAVLAATLAIQMAVALACSIGADGDRPLPYCQHAIEAAAWAIACARQPAGDESCPESQSRRAASVECARIVREIVGALPGGLD